jgi:hypothetical protein
MIFKRIASLDLPASRICGRTGCDIASYLTAWTMEPLCDPPVSGIRRKLVSISYFARVDTLWTDHPKYDLRIGYRPGPEGLDRLQRR